MLLMQFQNLSPSYVGFAWNCAGISLVKFKHDCLYSASIELGSKFEYLFDGVHVSFQICHMQTIRMALMIFLIFPHIFEALETPFSQFVLNREEVCWSM